MHPNRAWTGVDSKQRVEQFSILPHGWHAALNEDQGLTTLYERERFTSFTQRLVRFTDMKANPLNADWLKIASSMAKGRYVHAIGIGMNLAGDGVTRHLNEAHQIAGLRAYALQFEEMGIPGRIERTFACPVRPKRKTNAAEMSGWEIILQRMRPAYVQILHDLVEYFPEVSVALQTVLVMIIKIVDSLACQSLDPGTIRALIPGDTARQIVHVKGARPGTAAGNSYSGMGLFDWNGREDMDTDGGGAPDSFVPSADQGAYSSYKGLSSREP